MAVETDRGSIECEYFVNCAGQVNLRVGLWDAFGEASTSPTGNLDQRICAKKTFAFWNYSDFCIYCYI